MAFRIQLQRASRPHHDSAAPRRCVAAITAPPWRARRHWRWPRARGRCHRRSIRRRHWQQRRAAFKATMSRAAPAVVGGRTLSSTRSVVHAQVADGAMAMPKSSDAPRLAHLPSRSSPTKRDPANLVHECGPTPQCALRAHSRTAPGADEVGMEHAHQDVRRAGRIGPDRGC